MLGGGSNPARGRGEPADNGIYIIPNDGIYNDASRARLRQEHRPTLCEQCGRALPEGARLGRRWCSGALLLTALRRALRHA